MPDEFMEKFVNKVEQMRRVQSIYFRTRDYEDMRMAISLERDVDNMLREIRFRENRHNWQ